MKKLKEPTKVCKVCFKDFYERDLYHLLGGTSVCLNCYKEFQPKFIMFKVDKYSAISIYDYESKIQSTLYQLKGCYDIELGDVFLDRFKRELRLLFDGYVMVPVPSFKEEDEAREFNHVEEMFKIIGLPIVHAIAKTKKVKQASNDFKKRQLISKALKLIDGVDLKNKKVLIVDDVYTSGATMSASVKLIESLHPRKIRILVMSKTLFKP